MTKAADLFAVLEVVTDKDNPTRIISVKLNGLDISRFVQSLNYSAAKGTLPEFTITLQGYVTGGGNE